MSIILIVLLLILLFGGIRGSGNLRNVAWFLLVIVGFFLVLNLVS